METLIRLPSIDHDEISLETQVILPRIIETQIIIPRTGNIGDISKVCRPTLNYMEIIYFNCNFYSSSEHNSYRHNALSWLLLVTDKDKKLAQVFEEAFTFMC